MSCFRASVFLTRRDWLSGTGLLCAASGRSEKFRQIRPPDDVSHDSDLTALMTRVRTIVGRRDYRALSALMGSDFRVEFDVGQGPAVFARHWHPQSPSSAIWSVLGQIVRQGGALYSQSLYCLPHSVAYFPIDLDLMSNVVALHDSVSLLTKPEAGAAKAGTLRQSIIRLEASLEAPVLLRPGTFLAVRHSELGRCYVDSADVYHPAAHRAFLEKRNGRWRWISLASATLADPPDLLRLLEKRT